MVGIKSIWPIVKRILARVAVGAGEAGVATEPVLAALIAMGHAVVVHALAKAATLCAVVVEFTIVKRSFALAHASDVCPVPTVFRLAPNSRVLAFPAVIVSAVIRLVEEVSSGGYNGLVTALASLLEHNRLEWIVFV